MTPGLPLPDLSFSSPTAFGPAYTTSDAKVTINGQATDPGSIASWLLGYRSAAPNGAGAEAVNSTLAAKQPPAAAYLLAGVGIVALLLFLLVRRKRG